MSHEGMGIWSSRRHCIRAVRYQGRLSSVYVISPLDIFRMNKEQLGFDSTIKTVHMERFIEIERNCSTERIIIDKRKANLSHEVTAEGVINMARYYWHSISLARRDSESLDGREQRLKGPLYSKSYNYRLQRSTGLAICWIVILYHETSDGSIS